MLKNGDTVALKSGSPVMTIDTVADQYGTLTAWCSWFDSKKKMEATFPVTSLKLVNLD